jgi:hypothetical protein
MFWPVLFVLMLSALHVISGQRYTRHPWALEAERARRAEEQAALPTYCLCSQAFVYDPTGECLRSGQYGVANACFNCPVINATGTFNFCGSLIRMGYGACTQPGAASSMQAACIGIGGNTALTSYKCGTSTGADQSQITGCAPSAPSVPTSPPTSASPPIFAASPSAAPTAQPTNDAVAQHRFSLFLLLLIAVVGLLL